MLLSAIQWRAEGRREGRKGQSAVGEIWNQVYMTAPVEKIGSVRSGSDFVENKQKRDRFSMPDKKRLGYSVVEPAREDVSRVFTALWSL